MVIWLLLNLPLMFVLSAGFLFGILQPFFNSDITFISHVIFAFFLFSVFRSWFSSNSIEKDKKYVLSDADLHPELEKYLDVRYEALLHPTCFAMNLLVGLGFLGTVVGVIIGFQNLPMDAFSDITKMQAFVRQILVGFSVELHTLVMGLVGKLWLQLVVFFQEREILKIYNKIRE